MCWVIKCHDNARFNYDFSRSNISNRQYCCTVFILKNSVVIPVRPEIGVQNTAALTYTGRKDWWEKRDGPSYSVRFHGLCNIWGYTRNEATVSSINTSSLTRCHNMRTMILASHKKIHTQGIKRVVLVETHSYFVILSRSMTVYVWYCAT